MTPTSPSSAPESIVVSLEWAKKLKKAGFPDESIFIWHYCERMATDTKYGDYRNDHDEWKFRIRSTILPENLEGRTRAAPTAEEILRRLPERIKPMALTEMDERRMKDPPDLRFSINKTKVGWEIRYWSPYLETDEHQESDTLADAAAAMFVFLAESGLLPKA